MKDNEFKKNDIVIVKDAKYLDKGETIMDTIGVVLDYNPDNDRLELGVLHPEKYALPPIFCTRGCFYRKALDMEIKAIENDEKWTEEIKELTKQIKVEDIEYIPPRTFFVTDWAGNVKCTETENNNIWRGCVYLTDNYLPELRNVIGDKFRWGVRQKSEKLTFEYNPDDDSYYCGLYTDVDEGVHDNLPITETIMTDYLKDLIKEEAIKECDIEKEDMELD